MLPAPRRSAPTWGDPITASEYLGILSRTHGVDGSIVLSDTTGLRATLAAGSTVFVGFTRDFAEPMVLADYQQSQNRTILRFIGVDNPEAATTLLEKAVYVNADDVGVDDTHRHAVGDIEGSEAFDEQGALVGTVSEVWLLPAQDVWVITTPEGSTIPLPVLDHTVLSVDIANHKITVRIPDGLIDIDKARPGEEHDA